MQPETLVPVTVKMVVTVGLRICVAPTRVPGFQVYEFAPVAVTLTVPPTQMLAEEGVSVMFGNGVMFTFTVPGEALTHPSELVPDTE